MKKREITLRRTEKTPYEEAGGLSITDVIRYGHESIYELHQAALFYQS